MKISREDLTVIEDKVIINLIKKKAVAEFHPLDKLCLSPQYGFVLIEEGNVITEEQQWDKITLIKDISEEVWN